jgi:hypothetical protein
MAEQQAESKGAAQSQLADRNPGSGTRLLRWVRILGVVVIVVYVANAAARSVGFLVPRYGLGTYALGAITMMLIWLLSGLSWTPFRVAALVFGIYVAWAAISGSEPFSDFQFFARGAEQFARNPTLSLLHGTKSPATVVWYSAFTWLLGPGTIALNIAAASAWAMTGGLLLVLFREIGVTGRSGTFAVLLFSLAPGVVAYSVVVSTESVFLMLIVAAFASGYSSQHETTSRRFWTLAASSLLFGLAYLAIPTAVFFFAGFLVYTVSQCARQTERIRSRPIAAVVAAILVPFAAVVIFQISLNYRYGDSLSPSPSPYAAMVLLSGTNIETGGAWSREDMDLAGYTGPNQVPTAEANARAFIIARQRATADPLGMVTLAIGPKVVHLWGEEQNLLYWAMSRSERYPGWVNDSTIYSTLARVVNGYYGLAMVLLIPSIVVVVWRRLLGIEFLPILSGLVGTAILLLAGSPQVRYHLVFMPFVYLAISLAWVSIMPTWVRSWVSE